MLRRAPLITTCAIFLAHRFNLVHALSAPSTLEALAVSPSTAETRSHRHRISCTSLGMTSAEASPSSTTVANEETNDDGSMRFGKFLIPEASIFGHSPSSSGAATAAAASKKAFAFVNLRPIVPGHVLVAPTRVVPHLSDLTTDEYTELWNLVRSVQSVLKKAYPGTTAFNVAVQDGRAAGQSVPHVHVHLLPRAGGDLERNDDIYDALEAWAPTETIAEAKEKTDIEVPDDADRVDRTMQMMADEAAMYRGFAEPEGALFGDGSEEKQE